MADSASCRLISSRSLCARHRSSVISLICSPPALLRKNKVLAYLVSRKVVLQDRGGSRQPPACRSSIQLCPLPALKCLL